MTERPAVPADLRRRVLVEAGHRCAIHTCRSPDVDVHHIVPWERCQEHSYENLIALCPNCHRRATIGEIDRKSLRLYKAHLTAALGIATAAGSQRIPGAKIATTPRWVNSLLEDSQTSPVPYDISVEFPQFLPDEGDLAELNVVVQASALSRLQEYRRHRIMAPDATPPTTADGYWESFEVSLFTDDLISIKYSIGIYFAGAMHPNHFTRTANYQRDPLIPLQLGDIFVDEAAAISVISRYSQAALARQKHEDHPDAWIADGAGPDAKNFQAFNISQSGLLLTFDPYQVGAYAEGPYQVHIPNSEFTGILSPTTDVATTWRMGSAA